MRKWLALAALVAVLVCALIPSVSFTEDRDTVLLARTIYALGKDESYETKLAIGTVVMNRVENPWFGDTLGEVLEEQQQFPAGSRYDAESLQAAHAVLAGERALSGSRGCLPVAADSPYYVNGLPFGSISHPGMGCVPYCLRFVLYHIPENGCIMKSYNRTRI